jgi:hypothetical protein
MLVVS